MQMTACIVTLNEHLRDWLVQCLCCTCFLMLLRCMHTTGKAIQGKVTVTISRGRLVWYGGKLNIKPGTGRFIKLPANGPLFEGLQVERKGSVDHVISLFAGATGATPVHRDTSDTEPEGAKPSTDSSSSTDRQEL
eukprot:GHRR01028394.1.p1 GENE.GHRR01028394.1~~GHRR01028394.1.p1  ORF type:complete len:135 (-),score=35.42 GHRR01028394.1:2336-2740(-)